MAVEWNSTLGGGGEMWLTWRSEVTQALTSLAGQPGRIRAIVWMQGENDATQPAWARAYAANLDSLRSSMIQHLQNLGWQCSGMAFVCGRVLPNQTYAAAVRLAQTEQDVVVDTDDLKTLDSVHYDAGSVALLGTRFADAILAWPGERLRDYELDAAATNNGIRVRWRTPLDTTITLEASRDSVAWFPTLVEPARVSLRSETFGIADRIMIYRLSSPHSALGRSSGSVLPFP